MKRLLPFIFLVSAPAYADMNHSISSSVKFESLSAASTADKIGSSYSISGNNVTTVDEIFGEANPNVSDDIETKSDLTVDSPFQSLIEFVQGDMVVKTKNVYALKKLLDDDGAKLKLKSSSGQFLFSNNSETIGTSGEYFRLYYLESLPELTGGVVEKAKAKLGSLGG